MRGAKAIPATTLKLRGSKRAAKRSAVEPKIKRGQTECPQELEGEAHACWESLVPDLVAMGIWGTADKRAFYRYCQLWAEWLSLAEDIAANGCSEVGSKGTAVTRPESTRSIAIAGLLLRLEQDFGLTPSARARIGVARAEKRKGAEADKSRFFEVG